MPHPLDLSVPRVGVKYPYVPPMSGDAPKYRWDLSQYPAVMDKTQSVPDGKGGNSWLKHPGGLTPGAGYGMSVQHSAIEDSVLRNMYDVGEKMSEQETNPYTKSDKKWEHQYNLYRKSLGEIEDPRYQMKAEGEAYPDLTNPEVSPDEWKILQGQDFDVFDAFKDSGTWCSSAKRENFFSYHHSLILIEIHARNSRSKCTLEYTLEYKEPNITKT